VIRPTTQEIVMSSKSVEFHLIDTGHFALEDKSDEMVPLIRDFLGRKVARK
jgi:surfactin synthase thioesterase subunit